jgi:hypothetical protein
MHAASSFCPLVPMPQKLGAMFLDKVTLLKAGALLEWLCVEALKL